LFGSFLNLFHPAALNGAANNGTGDDSGSQGSAHYGAKPSWVQSFLGFVEQAVGIAGHATGGGSASSADSAGYGAGGSMSGRDVDPDGYGGGYALGGGVDTSGFYDVGEMGKERIWLPKGSHVQPHNQMSGGDVYYTINTGGVTGADVDMRVRSALEAYHPRGVKAAVDAVHDQRRRQATRS
jgi:hypothetical protein